MGWIYSILGLLIVATGTSSLSFSPGYPEAADCKDLGFTATQLCGDCDILQEYVKDEELAQECKSCCIEEEGNSSAQLFEGAVLEICKHRMREFPHVEGFIDKLAKGYENLKVSYKYGSYPKLVFKAAGSQKEFARIDNWTTDNIRDYLDSKLARPTTKTQST